MEKSIIYRNSVIIIKRGKEKTYSITWAVAEDNGSWSLHQFASKFANLDAARKYAYQYIDNGAKAAHTHDSEVAS